MKARKEPVNKSKASGLTRQVSGAGKPAASSANEDWPRRQMIAEAAYYRAERRGFAPGNEMADWLQAEADIDDLPERGR